MGKVSIFSMRPRRRLLSSVSLGGICTAFALMGGAASAQEEPGTTLIEDIVVTAQKREERLRDVPASVSALSGDALEELGYTRPQEVFQQIPNVSFNENGGLPQLNIRGVQLYDFGGGNEPPVGYYVDEVYMGTLGAHIGDIFDVERVEVLKGPQGTLFGRNTTGGLAHWVTRKPTSRFEGYGSLQYGSYDQFAVEGAISGPLSDRVRARAAAKYIRDDGWQTNEFIRGSRFSKDNNLSGRLHVEVDLTDNAQGLFSIHASRVRGQSNHVALMGLLNPTTGMPCTTEQAQSGICVSAVGSPSTFRDPKHVQSDIAKLAQNVDAVGGFARFNVSLSDNVELVSISAYEYVDRFYEQDADGSTAPVTTNLNIVTGGAVPLALPGFYNTQEVTAKQFSQELRLAGTTGGFKWIVGAFYYNDDKDNVNFNNVQAIQALEAAQAPNPGLGLENQARLDTKSWAIFGQADIRLTDQLSITAGGRYTDEKKDLVLSDDFAQPIFVDNEYLSEGAFTFRGSINYKPTDSALIFASAAKGFKSGAFKTTFALPGEGEGADKETLYSYELGTKAEIIPRRLQLNASVFYNDYRDLQVLSVGSRNGIPGSFLLNVGDAKVYGLEVDTTFVLVPGLEGSLGVGLLDTKIKSDNPVFDGNEQALSPKFRGNGIIRYTPQVEVLAGSVTLQASGTYMGKHFLTPENHATLKQESYVLLGANLSWTDRDERIGVDFFVNNILDEAYGVGAFQVPDFAFNGLFTGRPRTWGVKLSYNW